MSGYIGPEQLAAIKARVDLVDLVQEYTPLKKTGGGFVGCCVFHQERTGSMNVYPDQQRYHCFGCGANGDAVQLIMERERLPFCDAVEWLAHRVGFIIQPVAGADPRPSTVPRQSLLAACEMACAFYQQALVGPDAQEARDYLVERGITDASVDRFRIGWSLGRGTLLAEARRRGIDQAHLVACGLAVEGDTGLLRDFFFDRLMFPIFDHFGQCISFSGRLLPENEARLKAMGKGAGKYVNTADSALYHKGKVVWNLHRARSAARERGRLLIMEGPTDVIAADQAGLTECTAVMGCALSGDHLKRLSQVVGSGKLIAVLDGDSAGLDAGEKAARTALASGIGLLLARLPDQLDPAEMLDAHTGHGIAAFTEVVGQALEEVPFLLRHLASPVPVGHREKLETLDLLLHCVQPMPDLGLRDLLVGDLVTWFDVARSLIKPRLAEMDAKAKAAAEGAAKREHQRADAARERTSDEDLFGGGDENTDSAEDSPAGQEEARRAHRVQWLTMVRDGGFHLQLVGCLEDFIAHKGILPDAVGGWMRGEGAARISIKHRDLVNEFVYRHASAFESLPRERVDMTLSAMVQGQREKRRAVILDAITGKPASPAGRLALSTWLRAVTGREDPQELAVLLHFIWQVKRLNTERKVAHDMMPILRGLQGSGKSTAIRQLLSPLKELVLGISAAHLTDQRSFEVLSDYAVGFWGEMSGGSRAEIAALKHTMTAVDVNYRELGGHNHNLLSRRMAFIADTNERVEDIIADTTGARRYFQLESLDRVDWKLLDLVDPALCWLAVSEDDPPPIEAVLEQVRLRQADLVHRDVFDAWMDSEAHAGWAELVLVTEGVPFTQTGPATTHVPAYTLTRKSPEDGLPIGWTLEQIGIRFGQYCRLQRLSSRTPDWLAKRLRQAGWSAMRSAKTVDPRRVRTYRRPLELEALPVIDAGPTRGERLAADPSPAEDRFQAQATASSPVPVPVVSPCPAPAVPNPPAVQRPEDDTQFRGEYEPPF